jgi:hypothetical protein
VCVCVCVCVSFYLETAGPGLAVERDGLPIRGVAMNISINR